MDPSAREDAFGVQLEWPGDPVDQPDRLPSPVVDSEKHSDPATGIAADPAPAAAMRRSTQPSIGRDVVELASEAPDLESALRILAGVTARIDALAASTMTFREMTSRRGTEIEGRVSDAVSSLAEQLDQGTQHQARALEQVRADVASLQSVTHDLGRDISDLLEGVYAMRESIDVQLAQVSSDVDAVRKRIPLRSRQPELKLEPEQLEALAEMIRDTVTRDAGSRTSQARRTSRRA